MQNFDCDGAIAKRASLEVHQVRTIWLGAILDRSAKLRVGRMRGARSLRWPILERMHAARPPAKSALPDRDHVIRRIVALFEIERSVNGKRSVWMFGGR